ncbi:MAG: phage tail protein [Actinobacteria bacterium]|nr:phage tail protein [Actinomycetota bacterium]
MPDSQEKIASTYPIPGYLFTVTIGNEQMAFNQVSGLDQSVETIQYRDGLGKVYQMPGQRSPLTITLRRGIVPQKSELYDWLNSINFNRADKRDLSISLTNESGSELLVTWNVSNAFPTKLSAPALDATSNQVAMEEVTLAADRVSMVFH